MLLRQQWSPEQISGRLQLEQQPTVSHERIYLYIYADKSCGGTLYQHLRSQKKQRMTSPRLRTRRWYASRPD